MGSHPGNFPGFPRNLPLRLEINESRPKQVHTPHMVEKNYSLPAQGRLPALSRVQGSGWLSRAGPHRPPPGGQRAPLPPAPCAHRPGRGPWPTEPPLSTTWPFTDVGRRGLGPTARDPAPRLWDGAQDPHPRPRGCCWSRDHTGDAEAVRRACRAASAGRTVV